MTITPNDISNQKLKIRSSTSEVECRRLIKLLASQSYIDRILLHSMAPHLPKKSDQQAYSDSLSKFSKWFSQFKENEEKVLASFIVDELRIIREAELNQKLDSIAKKIQNFISKNNIKSSCILPLENSTGQSGAKFCNRLGKATQALGLRIDFIFEDRNQITFEQALLDFDLIILVDDIVGTGGQATHTFKKSFINKGATRIVYSPVVAFRQGIDNIRDRLRNDPDIPSGYDAVLAGEILSETAKVFSEQSQHFASVPLRGILKEFATTYGRWIYPKHPLGYGNSQALITFTDTCPNNTLPIIWGGKDTDECKYAQRPDGDDENWIPLFRRVKKKKSKKFTISEQSSVKDRNQTSSPNFLSPLNNPGTPPKQKGNLHPDEINLDLRRRLYLFECKFGNESRSGWNKKKWASLWGYANASSVSRIFNGTLKLQSNKIKKTCEKAKIPPELFFVNPIENLARELKLPIPISFPPELYASTLHRVDTIPPSKNEILMPGLKFIKGDYIYAYSGRDERSSEKLVIFEKIRIEQTSNAGIFRLNQPSNIVTQEASDGTGRIRNGILELDIKYLSEFPNSRLMLKPLFVNENIQIMSGLYLDVSVQVDLQIFSTQCHLFKVNNIHNYPDKIRHSLEGKEYDLWRKSFEDPSFGDDRLLGKSGHICYNIIRNAVVETRKREIQ